jgi:polyphosphate kinase 2 (PPK2 family)
VFRATTKHRPRSGGSRFERALEKLQIELVKLQEWVKQWSQDSLNFEGRDAP